jgi:hypothetical protein
VVPLWLSLSQLCGAVARDSALCQTLSTRRPHLIVARHA